MAKTKKTTSNPTRLNPFGRKERGVVLAVIETPRGSRNKFKYDEKIGFFSLSGVLPEGKQALIDASEKSLSSQLAGLQAVGASYYPWVTDALPRTVTIPDGAMLARLVTSFATTADEVDEFVATAMAR